MKNTFLKGVTQNHCLGFLVMHYQGKQRQTGLKASPYLLQLAPLNKHNQEPWLLASQPHYNENQKKLILFKNNTIVKTILCRIQLSNKRHIVPWRLFK